MLRSHGVGKMKRKDARVALTQRIFCTILRRVFIDVETQIFQADKLAERSNAERYRFGMVRSMESITRALLSSHGARAGLSSLPVRNRLTPDSLADFRSESRHQVFRCK